MWKAAQAAVSEALDAKELDIQIRSLRRLTKTALALRPPRLTRLTRLTRQERSNRAKA